MPSRPVTSICTSTEAIVAFDAGHGRQALQGAFAQLALRPQDVSAAFLTHGDRDYTDGLDVSPAAEAYLSTREEPMVTGRRPRMLERVSSPPLQRTYRLLEDGQSVQIGNVRVKAIATSGHRAGPVSYLTNERALFTGDALSLRGGWVAPFVRLINMAHRAQLASIPTLAALEKVEMVCTGHSGRTQTWDHAVAPWRA